MVRYWFMVSYLFYLTTLYTMYMYQVSKLLKGISYISFTVFKPRRFLLPYTMFIYLSLNLSIFDKRLLLYCKQPDVPDTCKCRQLSYAKPNNASLWFEMALTNNMMQSSDSRWLTTHDSPGVTNHMAASDSSLSPAVLLKNLMMTTLLSKPLMLMLRLLMR